MLGQTPLKIAKNALECDLKLACHNINGLKSNNQKLLHLLDWAKEKDIDILEITETNISDKEGHYILPQNSPYKICWTSSSSNKKKGSGLGVAIGEKIQKYTGNFKKHNEYLLEFYIILKCLRLDVLIVYLPPNDSDQIKKIQQQVISIYLDRARNFEVIIMGDFNHIVTTDLDKFSASSTTVYKKLPLHNWLSSQKFVDTFRYLNPNTQTYTWTNGSTAT